MVNYRIDEKGKIFTPRIAKLHLPVTACIGDWLVEGIVHYAWSARSRTVIPTPPCQSTDNDNPNICEEQCRGARPSPNARIPR